MRLIDEIPFDKAKLDAIKNEAKLTDEQVETLKYEVIGRALMDEVNIFDAFNGRIRTISLFEAMLLTLATRDAYIITSSVQPLFDINNKYMGFADNGKIRNLKKEWRFRKIKREISWAIGLLMAFIIGLNAPVKITLLFLIFVAATGYSYYLIIGETRFRR